MKGGATLAPLTPLSFARLVLLARDRFLKPDGLMLPALAKLYMTPVQAEQTYAGGVVGEGSGIPCNDHPSLADWVDFWRDKVGGGLLAAGFTHPRPPPLLPPRRALT